MPAPKDGTDPEQLREALRFLGTATPQEVSQQLQRDRVNMSAADIQEHLEALDDVEKVREDPTPQYRLGDA